MSASAHGRCTGNNRSPLDGSRPQIAYPLDGITHLARTADHKGGEQVLIDWAKMTPAAREALRKTDFGRAICPFKDGRFSSGKAA